MRETQRKETHKVGMFTRNRLAAAVALSAAVLTSTASAQNFVLEEIVVTAQKRAQSLQDVPISVAAVSGEQISNAGITGLEELSLYTPNVNINQGKASPNLYIRGIGSGTNSGFEQSVGMYVDGVYAGRGQLSNVPTTMDLERVEILKGPQGILFGKNTIGGAINVTSAKPTDEFESYIEALYEPEHGEEVITGVVSGPLTEAVSGRLAVRKESFEGWWDDVLRDEQAPDRDMNAREELGYTLGMQAYLYGIPALRLENFRYGFHRLGMLANMLDRGHLIGGIDDGVEFNELLHARVLSTPEAKFGLTPNVDTTYSSIFYDLQHGPLVLSVPEIKDRYYSVQIVDAYLSNAAYLGTRATDAVAGDYLLIGPDWQGAIPENMMPIHLPTNEGFFAIRILVDGQKDLQNVVKIQDQFHVKSLPVAEGLHEANESMLVPEPDTKGELSEYRRIVEIAQRNPPKDPRTLSMWQSFKHIGLSLDKPFDPASIDSAIKKGMRRALESTENVIAWKVKYRGYKSESMWNVDLRGGSYEQDYLARAEGAIQGLIVHDSDEGMYFHSYHDGDGELLNGSERYEVHFPANYLPPVKAFWSMTAYTDAYNLVENEIERYSIGDRTEGLKYNPDGSLTLYIQSTPPAEGTSNWLPTPDGDLFRINFRMYMPKPVMKDKDKLEAYLPPLVKQA